MQNPWLNLPSSPEFIAPADLPFITDDKNKSLRSWYNFDLFPDPYVGNIDTATVLFLSNNPRVSPIDYKNLENSAFVTESFKSLRHHPEASLFYWKDTMHELDGYTFWWKLLGKSTATIENISDLQLSKRMLQVELIGYHSKTYKPFPGQILPSQAYSFWLVSEAMKSGKLIVIMRGASSWFSYIPGLRTYHGLILLDNNQQPFITKGNMKENQDNYYRLVDALKA